MRSRGNSRHRNGRGPDLVRHVLADEDHLYGCGRTRPLAAEAGNRDEEIQAAYFAGRGIVDRRETAAAEAGKDRLRGAADKHHCDRGVDGATAAGEHVSPRPRGRWVPSGDASSHPHLTPFLTPASLMVAGGRG